MKWLVNLLAHLILRDMERFEGKLDQILNSVKEHTMKLSEIKAAVAASAKQSTEAFAELGGKIADLQKQVDDLIAGAQDPDVTDEAFLSDLNTLKSNVAQLADIVPNPEPPVEPPTA